MVRINVLLKKPKTFQSGQLGRTHQVHCTRELAKGKGQPPPKIF